MWLNLLIQFVVKLLQFSSSIIFLFCELLLLYIKDIIFTGSVKNHRTLMDSTSYLVFENIESNANMDQLQEPQLYTPHEHKWLQ